MGDLETLEAVAAFSFLSSNIENGVNELSSFSVVALGPVVSGTALTEDEVVRSEELTKRSSSDGIHCSGFEIHKDSSGDVSSAGSFIVVDIDSLELEIRVTVVRAGGVDSVLIGDNLPEFSTNLVSALTALDVDDFSHVFKLL